VIKHRNPSIRGGAPLYKMYFECARRFYGECNGKTSCEDPACRPAMYSASFVQLEGFAQICHAASDDGIHWRAFNSAVWDATSDYAPSPNGFTPVVSAAPRVLENCNVKSCNGHHWASFDGRSSCTDLMNNYGVGHPTAVVMSYDDKGQTTEEIWLWYYDSKGAWEDHGVYLAKSRDGFHFGTAVRTNLSNPVDVRFFATNAANERDGGLFVATLGVDATNAFVYSNDGVTWSPTDANGSQRPIRIGTADPTRCVAPAQASIVADPHGHIHSVAVDLLSGEGRYAAAENGPPSCLDTTGKEERFRGATWGLFRLSGRFW
jgi:hypothetical protein